MFLAFWLDKNTTRYIVTYVASSGEKVDCLRRVMNGAENGEDGENLGHAFYVLG
jgi:hypothetical protein